MTEREMARKKAAARKAKARKARNRRVLTTAILMLAVCVVSIGGTIAWLQASTTPVVNTFTPSDIKIKLEETLPADRTAKMVPGGTIDKDPKVTIEVGSEACWVFVKIEESNNLNKYISYTVDPAWTALDATKYPGVYYLEQAALTAEGSANAVYSVLKDDKVTVNTDVTKADMNGLGTDSENYPKLTFTAYAVQQANVAKAEGDASVQETAWKLASAQQSTGA